MKKTSVVVTEKDSFEVKFLINNTGYIISTTGKSGLLDMKNNKIIGKMDNYYTIYNKHRGFYYQEKEIKDQKHNKVEVKKTVRIYDTQEEKMIVDGWEVVKQFANDYELTAVKSPRDGKIHLFDRNACRQNYNIFNMALDDAELLSRENGEIYLAVTINGEKGIYCFCQFDKKSELITPIEFDDIQKFPNIIVCTKKQKKCFIYDNKNDEISQEFDEIVFDEKNKNIIYCKKDKRIYVYNTDLRELLLDEECDEVKCLCSRSERGLMYPDNEFYFTITKNNLKGLQEIKRNCWNHKVIKEKRELLPPEYDDIEHGRGVFYLKKGGKTGLFKDFGKNGMIVEANSDRIVDLGQDMYAFYNGDRCDIYRIVGNKLNRLINNCQLISSQEHGYIFEQHNLYGILRRRLAKSYSSNKDIVSNLYENIRYLDEGYYEVERNGKKGVNVNYRVQDIIPTEYDTINIKFYKNKLYNEFVYFALGKKDLGFALAKKEHWDYGDNDVKFLGSQMYEEINLFEDIITLRTKEDLLLYDYDEKLLKKFPASSQISVIYRRPDSVLDKKPIYIIDGTYYYYKDGNFKEVLVEENEYYVTTYETETDTFEIKTLNKVEHDSFCKIIDSQEEVVAEQLLKDIFENNGNEIRQQYSSLALNRKPKTNQI